MGESQKLWETDMAERQFEALEMKFRAEPLRTISWDIISEGGEMTPGKKVAGEGQKSDVSYGALQPPQA